MTEVVVKQRANVYTVMLVVSFLCLCVANLFLYFEMNRWNFVLKVPAELKASNAAANAKQAAAAPTEEVPAEPAPGEAEPMPAADGEPMPAVPPADDAAPAEPAANPEPADPAAAMPAENP